MNPIEIEGDIDALELELRQSPSALIQEKKLEPIKYDLELIEKEDGSLEWIE